MKLKDCDCDFTELENKANSSVKGYSLTTECSVCKAAREAQNAAEAIKRAEREKEAEKAALIKQKSEDIAVSELKKDGKLDEAGNVVKEA